jgi:hypothetical protein
VKKTRGTLAVFDIDREFVEAEDTLNRYQVTIGADGKPKEKDVWKR